MEVQAWDAQELRAWLSLLLVPRLGPVKARRLLAALGSPQAVFQANGLVWSEVLGQRWPVDGCQPLAEIDQQLQLTLQWLGKGDGRAIITLADPRYPSALLQTADPPLLFFVHGQLHVLQRAALAIVGSRHATPQGAENAHAFAQAFSSAGVCVVSGLADGIDAAAHSGAMAAVQAVDSYAKAAAVGSTLAVVGTGIDVVYPTYHQKLAAQISTHGLVLSEFLLGTPPRASNFPKRNRIVAGLSQGTLVVEASLQSGSLITARLAAEMGREVFAIPGSIHSPQSRGCHALIKQGAKLVETAQDVLEEINGAALKAWPAPLNQTVYADHNPAIAHDSSDDPLLQAMGYEPVSQEALSARTGLGPADLGPRLLELELTGQVTRLPGLLFQRMAQA